MSADVPQPRRRGQAPTRPPVDPPTLTPRVKDALGRALMQGVARVERYLSRRGLPPAEIEDFALECACLTYRNIASGTIEVPADAADYEPRFGAYMITMAWRLVSNRRRFKDVFRRNVRDGGMPEIEARTYEVEPALELASEIRAEPPRAQLFLLAMLDNGAGTRFCHEAAVAVGLKRTNGREALRRTRERAARRLAAA